MPEAVDIKIRLFRAQAGSCTCGIRPSARFEDHDAMCRYRLFLEAENEIERLRASLAHAERVEASLDKRRFHDSR